jgi:hypothetical protein
MTITWIEKNGSGNNEVHTVVLFNQSGDVLSSASPDGDVTFHVIGTVVQQASQGRCVGQIGTVAQCVGRCSQRVGNVHAPPPLSRLRGNCSLRDTTLVCRFSTTGSQHWPLFTDHDAHRKAIPQ